MVTTPPVQAFRKIQRNIRHVRWAFRNLRNGRRIRRELAEGGARLSDAGRYERRYTSQNGEDGILEAIFAVLGPRVGGGFVEFGAGRRCNALRLVSQFGFSGLWMDPRGAWAGAPLPVVTEFVTAENVESLFDRHGVPHRPDLLSIDIDGNDYWVWRALRSRRPRVVVIEYNAALGPDQSLTIPYDPGFVWTRTDFYGASLTALTRLARAKGYALVACDSSGTNAFFVDGELLRDRLVEAPVQSTWRPPRLSAGRPWPIDHRPRVEVAADGEPTVRLVPATRGL
jgi:hypothetical protein